MRKQNEYNLHVAFYDWFCLNALTKKFAKYLFAIEHGEPRSPRIGAKLKRKGVKKGMTDFFLVIPNFKYNGLWIEIKIGRNKMTSAQLEFKEIVEECNYKHICCWSLDELILEVSTYLGYVQN